MQGVATMWRRDGATAVLIPTDPGMPETVVVSDLFAASVRRESLIWPRSKYAVSGVRLSRTV